MRFITLVKRFLLIDFFQGMAVTFRSQKPSELVTEQYPLERPKIADGFRGQPRLTVDPETGQTKCIACGLCVTACPEKLIKVEGERNPETKKKQMTTFSYDISRCMFCGLCQEACPQDCLVLSKDYEMAQYSREGMELTREQLEQGQKPKEYKQ
jgi:NADH-quinone oxidoreductase subunit I